MLIPIGNMESFDMDLYRKVYRARGGSGNGNIPNHKWIGKAMYRNGKFYTVEKVLKHWYLGNYLVLLLNNGHDSHVLVYWENISCVEPTVLESINENRKNSCIIA